MLFQSHQPTVPRWGTITAGTAALLGIVAGGIWWYTRHADGYARTRTPMSTPASQDSYEAWTYEELYQRAREKEVEGRSTMNKSELIAALRASA